MATRTCLQDAVFPVAGEISQWTATHRRAAAAGGAASRIQMDRSLPAAGGPGRTGWPPSRARGWGTWILDDRRAIVSASDAAGPTWPRSCAVCIPLSVHLGASAHAGQGVRRNAVPIATVNRPMFSGDSAAWICVTALAWQ